MVMKSSVRQLSSCWAKARLLPLVLRLMAMAATMSEQGWREQQEKHVDIYIQIEQHPMEATAVVMSAEKLGLLVNKAAYLI